MCPQDLVTEWIMLCSQITRHILTKQIFQHGGMKNTIAQNIPRNKYTYSYYINLTCPKNETSMKVNIVSLSKKINTIKTEINDTQFSKTSHKRLKILHFRF